MYMKKVSDFDDKVEKRYIDEFYRMGYNKAGSKEGKGVKSKKYFFYNFSFFSKKSQEHYYF